MLRGMERVTVGIGSEEQARGSRPVEGQVGRGGKALLFEKRRGR